MMEQMGDSVVQVNVPVTVPGNRLRCLVYFIIAVTVVLTAVTGFFMYEWISQKINSKVEFVVPTSITDPPEQPKFTTREPCHECPKPPDPPKCPTNAPCPEPQETLCPTKLPCPECPQLPELPTCPTREPCPKPSVCPTSTPCPDCPTVSNLLAIPTSTPCPVCPEQRATPSPTFVTCPDCPKPPESNLCPTSTHCQGCTATPEPTPCTTCPSCNACPSPAEPPTCPTCMPCPEPTPCPTGADNHRSCLELLKQGNTQSGIYVIYVQGLGKHIEVYCDQDTDGGGWIVFQRRQDGSVDFYRGWNSYQFGFGPLGGEFWLGLEILYHFTTSMICELRIDLQSFDSEERLAKYSTFVIGSESSNYVLTADGYTGNAGDSLCAHHNWAHHNGQPFSTKDADHDDANNASCAQRYKGGWWYTSCHASNLNGLYLNGEHASYADGIEWYYWKGYYYSLKSTEMKVREWTGTRKPKSCLDWLKQGHSKSAIYQIYVAGMDRNVEVYCDQDTDGGGWIVFQRRQNGSMDFYRGWNSYQFGFGQLEGEFWLGLEILYHFTISKSCDLRIDLQSFDSEERLAKYSTFVIGSESSNYVLTADGYTGNAGDSLRVHNGQPFSTKDADHDANDSSCAQIYKGGWWYASCHHSNLNGLYLNGTHASFADGIEWYHWKGHYYSLKSTEMKFREKPGN